VFILREKKKFMKLLLEMVEKLNVVMNIYGKSIKTLGKIKMILDPCH